MARPTPGRGRLVRARGPVARRVDYPILERKAAYLINNSLGAMHRDTRARLAEFAELWDTDGVVAWATWFPEMTRVADLLGTIIGAPPGTTILRQSVADALNAVVSCLDFAGPRNRVVTTAADWPGTHYMWAEHCRRHGGELVVVPVRAGRRDGRRAAGRRAVDDRTLVVSVSLVQFRTSTLLDSRRSVTPPGGTVRCCCSTPIRRSGAVPVDVVVNDVDVCVGGSVKFLCGGPGQRLALHPSGPRRVAAPSAVGWISHERAVRLRVGRDRLCPGIQRFAGGTPERAGGVRRVARLPGDRRRRARPGPGAVAVADPARSSRARSSAASAYGRRSTRSARRSRDPRHRRRANGCTSELIERGFIVDYRPGRRDPGRPALLLDRGGVRRSRSTRWRRSVTVTEPSGRRRPGRQAEAGQRDRLDMVRSLGVDRGHRRR